jgi:Raf kinase inhibitor-like YbhB/YbcL family protein
MKILLLFILCILRINKLNTMEKTKTASFALYSNSFKDGDKINDEYTPQGDDLNPELHWNSSDIPIATKSLALAVEDPDAPRGTWYHWLVINIPSNINNIPENSVPGTEITNSWGIVEYKGPSPPKKQKHRYYYKLFALSVDKINVNDIKSFYTAVNKYKIGEGSIMGVYSK